MPKLFPPSLLEDPKAKAFCLQSQICNIHSLRHHFQETVWLGIDVEGCEGIREGVTSTGLAILYPADFRSTPILRLPFVTQEVVDMYHIESYCIMIEGRRRKKPQPSFPFGGTIQIANLGMEVQATVKDIKVRYEKEIILVDWNPQPRDLPAIQAFAPTFFQEAAGWVDVVDVMQWLCFSKQEDLRRTWPSLNDVMLCVRFQETCLLERRMHSAGSDAIHTVIVLARLLTYTTNELPVEVRRRRLLKQWRNERKRGSRTIYQTQKMALDVVTLINSTGIFFSTVMLGLQYH